MLSILRRSSTVCHGYQVEPVSITCRGTPIDREALFAYTNGHFLSNEEHQNARRYLRFDVDALCNAVAEVGEEPSPVIAIDKLEGGVSKALSMRRADGTEYIAKLPCRIAGPISLTTACEVGILKYVRKETGIPVPHVLSWSSDEQNHVGAEYIIMEKASGVPLFQKWSNMTELQKLHLIKNLTEFEAQLAAIKFPAYGGLYSRTEMSRLSRPLDHGIDPSQSFCIGPSCDRSFKDFDFTSDCDQGPWGSVSSFGISIAKRELTLVSKEGRRSQYSFDRGSIEQNIKVLEAAMCVMKLLDSNQSLKDASQPMLWHTDLHMGNIFVAADDPSMIVSLIDFQSISILPAFLQVQWPVFLRPPPGYDYTRGIFHPKLPDDYNTLDEQSKSIAFHAWSQVKLAKAYEVSTFLENRTAHDVMDVPNVFRELFIQCGEVSEMGVAPLRECLIKISRNWSSLGFTGECSYSFSQDELAAHEREFDEYRAWSEVQALAIECLDTDAEGWIAPQLDVNKKRRQNKELMVKYIERIAGQKSVEEVKAMWPFPVESQE